MRSLVLTVLSLILGIVTVGCMIHTNHVNTPRACHFDGGGTIAIGDAARTTDGREWLCTEDGILIRVTGYRN